MNVVAFLIAMGIFTFSLWLMSIAPAVVGFEAILFLAAILLASFAIAIPVNILGRSDGV
ncbi:hypothetical protein [Agromyces sp. H66]|uniref:hypothetical protein n=1 Tax=Agromyces sp. H66 TaxID=2529859 RepID=UPI00145ADBEE|nr:hypothetical protein [Agromyces sp. H66]